MATDYKSFLYAKFTKAAIWCRREFPCGENYYFKTDPNDPGQNEFKVTEQEYKARKIREVFLYEEVDIPINYSK